MVDPAERPPSLTPDQITEYLRHIGVKTLCSVCETGLLLPFDEPSESTTVVEFEQEGELLKRTLPAIIFVCARCGYMRKHARLATESSARKFLAEKVAETERSDG